MSSETSTLSNRGGFLFPLDMFRPTILAAALGEGLAAKARNALGAELVLTRHPSSQLLLARIEGAVVGDDEAAFWRDNGDLVLIASQVLPRQVFLFYVEGGDTQRQGFVVAQRGQAVAADEADTQSLPPEASAADLPVSRLLDQMGITLEDLQGGFEGGPQVRLSLVEPSGDERELLMTLAGQPPEGEGEPAPADAPPQAEAPGGAPATPAAPRAPGADEDQRRRAQERQAELDARAAMAADVRADLPMVRDELGVVVAPKAELGDADILAPYGIAKIEGDLPEGLPRNLHDELQGQRCDFVVGVEFLSEVFIGATPLSKPHFEEHAQTRQLSGVEVRVLEVLAPRLGVGTLIRREREGLFISRAPTLPLPEAFLAERLGK